MLMIDQVDNGLKLDQVCFPSLIGPLDLAIMESVIHAMMQLN